MMAWVTQAAIEKSLFWRDASLNQTSDLKALHQTCLDQQGKLKERLREREDICASRDSINQTLQR